MFAKLAKTAVQIRGGILAIHAAINETDEIGKMVIPEESRHRFSTKLHAQRLVKTIRIGRNALRIAKESRVQRSAKYAFIRAEPLEAFLGGDGQSLIGNGAFRRPESRGLHAEHAFVIFACAPQLFARILRMAVGTARQWRAGIGHASDIRIADQRKDGVVKRRGAEFNLARLSYRAVLRQNQPEQF